VFDQLTIQKTTGPTDYRLLLRQVGELIHDEPNLIANLANISALLYQSLSDINWAGFYLWNTTDSQLVLGPFQGMPACIRIDSGSGVCGTAFSTGKTQLVGDVHAFPGHIACDSASNSEIVVPVITGQKPVAVLDIDSPRFNRFNGEDLRGLEDITGLIAEELNWQ
jgi:L-methionine (R)-S-oxide reductase